MRVGCRPGLLTLANENRHFQHQQRQQAPRQSLELAAPSPARRVLLAGAEGDSRRLLHALQEVPDASAPQGWALVRN